MRHRTLSVVLLHDSGRISSSNNGNSSILCGSNHIIHDTFRSMSKVVKFKDPHRSIPHDCFGPFNGISKSSCRLWTNIQTHPSIRNAPIIITGSTNFCILCKGRGSHVISWQVNGDFLCGSLLQNARDQCQSILIQQTSTNLD